MHALLQQLLKNPEQFDFYQAVHLLEISIRDTKRGQLRFKHNPSFIFPVADIKKIVPLGEYWQIIVNFMGLIGPTGLLPYHDTTLVIERLQHKDTTLCHFLDIFQQRLVSLFYKTWKKSHFYLTLEDKNLTLDKKEIFSRVLLSLIGQGTPQLQNRCGLLDEVLLYYAAYFANKTHSMMGMSTVLSDYFKVPIQAIPFQKKTLQLPSTEKSSISCRDSYNQHFNILGKDVVCGNRQREYQYHFRLRIGPLDATAFNAFLPDQRRFEKLVQLTKRCIRLELTFDIQLILLAAEVPYCSIGKSIAKRLGWNTWLKVKPFAADASPKAFQITVRK